jgi:16S rRNA (uracil1498-N3)-methyltransferase
VARPDETRAAKRVERWERIAAEASRQCGRDELPRILAPALLDEVLRRCASEMHGILLWEGEDSTSLSSCLSHFDTNRGVTLVIGPEGGLTDDEVGRARGLGYHTASMGPLILRTETAAIAACALVQHFLGGLEPTEQASEA